MCASKKGGFANFCHKSRVCSSLQLKERKRIEEAGGFVSHNGVWRVQGILAVSRCKMSDKVRRNQ